MTKSLGVLAASVLLPAVVWADGLQSLEHFMRTAKAGQAQFTQTVTAPAKEGQAPRTKTSSGDFTFQRPGQFKFTYTKPFAQTIVADGKTVWLYDVDLNQVTVKKLDAALGSSPAALLAGSNEIERGFNLTESGSREGLDWLEAIAKTHDSSFGKILMAFNAQAELVIMELNDTFGHKTVLRFSGLKRNPQLPSSQFRFMPPKGADVLSD